MNGDGINKNFKYSEVVDVDALLGELAGVKLPIHKLKEPYYVWTLMTSYGMLEQVGENENRTHQKKEPI